jgi:hypothetical protein
VVWDTWQRYAVPTGYDLTGGGKITCEHIRQAVNVLEKYYRHNEWLANRVAVALHNFWNGLFIDENTLSKGPHLQHWNEEQFVSTYRHSQPTESSGSESRAYPRSTKNAK